MARGRNELGQYTGKSQRAKKRSKKGKRRASQKGRANPKRNRGRRANGFGGHGRAIAVRLGGRLDLGGFGGGSAQQELMRLQKQAMDLEMGGFQYRQAQEQQKAERANAKVREEWENIRAGFDRNLRRDQQALQQEQRAAQIEQDEAIRKLKLDQVRQMIPSVAEMARHQQEILYRLPPHGQQHFNF
jgi:hypothetical protein